MHASFEVAGAFTWAVVSGPAVVRTAATGTALATDWVAGVTAGASVTSAAGAGVGSGTGVLVKDALVTRMAAA